MGVHEQAVFVNVRERVRSLENYVNIQPWLVQPPMSLARPSLRRLPVAIRRALRTYIHTLTVSQCTYSRRPLAVVSRYRGRYFCVLESRP